MSDGRKNLNYLGSSFAASRSLNPNFAIHRKELRDKLISEKAVIFCIPNFFEIEVGLQKMTAFSLTGKIGAPPRRAANFKELKKCRKKTYIQFEKNNKYTHQQLIYISTTDF